MPYADVRIWSVAAAAPSMNRWRLSPLALPKAAGLLSTQTCRTLADERTAASRIGDRVPL